jgi:hypothetical protein
MLFSDLALSSGKTNPHTPHVDPSLLVYGIPLVFPVLFVKKSGSINSKLSFKDIVQTLIDISICVLPNIFFLSMKV